MKKTTFIMVWCVVTLLVLSCGVGYGQDRCIKANIPFSFSVNGKILPAGAYTAAPLIGSSVLHLRNADTLKATAVLIVATEQIPSDKQSTAMLVFHRYGDQYFLAKIWMGAGTETGFQVPKSTLEHKLAKAHPKPELIMVAAK